MAIFLWIIFLSAGLWFLALIFAKIPQVIQTPVVRKIKKTSGENLLSYFWHLLKNALGKIWHFILEAKDLTPSKQITKQVDRVRQAFRIRVRKSDSDPQWLPEATELVLQKSEQVKERSPEDIYLEAIKSDPLDISAYEGLGRLYLQERNFEEAFEIFQYLTVHKPQKDIYWSNLALCFYSLKKFDKAAEAYEKALNINNKIPARWINLALCFEALDEPVKAIKATSQALQLDKRNVGYMMFLANIYIKIENFVRAEEMLEQILELEPTNNAARQKLMKLKI
ncbi:MAG: tetratricopeptide repeat protein [Candidatus Doudnabacteria bacterium]|nr:tetratricopeptide repeat protein [Candidatus Doudnabacteria bacterium]